MYCMFDRQRDDFSEVDIEGAKEIIDRNEYEYKELILKGLKAMSDLSEKEKDKYGDFNGIFYTGVNFIAVMKFLEDGFLIGFDDGIEYYGKETYIQATEQGIHDLNYYLDCFGWVGDGPYKVADGIDYTKIPLEMAYTLLKVNVEWWKNQKKTFKDFREGLKHFMKLCRLIENLENTEIKFAQKLREGGSPNEI